MYDYTGNNWSRREGNKRYKEKLRSDTKKTLNRVITKDS